MGLDIHGVRFMLHARSAGADFARTATIGRQAIHLQPAELRAALREFGYTFEAADIESVFDADGAYAERFFRCLGACEVHSFDKSGYEGASHLHDMNLEIPDEHRGRYTVVLDGGSLEHVFNLPVALGNCLEMVEVGGYYLGISPANNFLGHGFYQFSPELFFSVFKAANGFEAPAVMAFEAWPGAPWYSVRDPASIGGRVTLRNRRPVYLLVAARKTAAVKPFASPPQQSDYLAEWDRNPGARRRSALLDFARRALPYPVRQWGKWLSGIDRAGFRPRDFLPVARGSGTRDLRFGRS